MLRPLLVLSWLLLFASEVGAQPLFYTVETLDWMAADSQVVVRGVVVDFVDEVDGAKQKWNTVVIRVRATLKGKQRVFKPPHGTKMIGQKGRHSWNSRCGG